MEKYIVLFCAWKIQYYYIVIFSIVKAVLIKTPIGIFVEVDKLKFI